MRISKLKLEKKFTLELAELQIQNFIDSSVLSVLFFLYIVLGKELSGADPMIL